MPSYFGAATVIALRVFVLPDPAVHVLVDERLYLRGPSLDAGAGRFALLQSDDELGALAVGDIEHPGFPGEERGHGGARSLGAMYAAPNRVRWRAVSHPL